MKKTTKVPLFEFRLIMYDSVKEMVDENNLDLSYYANGGLACEFPNNIFIMASEGADYATAVHEALHIAYFILGRVGVYVDKDNHEMLAYLQGWIVYKYMEKFCA